MPEEGYMIQMEGEGYHESSEGDVPPSLRSASAWVLGTIQEVLRAQKSNDAVSESMDEKPAGVMGNVDPSGPHMNI